MTTLVDGQRCASRNKRSNQQGLSDIDRNREKEREREKEMVPEQRGSIEEVSIGLGIRKTLNFN